MFNWFKKKARDSIDASQRGEAEHWIQQLKNMSNEEVALVLLMASNAKSFIKKKYNIDPEYPALCISKMPSIILNIGSDIKYMQSKAESGGLIVASGFFVWLYTLRAEMNLTIRDTGRNLWAELSRGIPHIDEAIIQAHEIGITLSDTSNAHVIPHGFTPI